MITQQITDPFTVVSCEVPEPVPAANDVLLRIKAVGLCGSDLATYRGINPLAGYPRIPGHEIAAEIVATGPDVPVPYEPGTLVTVLPYTACGDCSSCRAGRVNCCRYNQTLGVQRDGAAAEYIVVPYKKIIPVTGFSVEQAVLIEPLSVGCHAVNRAGITRDECVLIFGCGMIGLGAVLTAACSGARVIAVDIDDSKLETAKSLGAEFCINSLHDQLDTRVQDITGGDGPSVAIEAIGLPETFVKAVELACFAGRVVYIGYTKEPVAYDSKLFVSKELDIRGSRNATQQEFDTVITMLNRTGIDPDLLITQRYALSDCAEALEFWHCNPARVTKIILEQ